MLNLRKYIADNPEKTERVISRLEIVGLLAIMAAVFLMMKKNPFGNNLLIIGLSTLAWVYAFLGVVSKEIFALKTDKLFAHLLRYSYLAIAVTMMGILFMLMRWKGGSMMLKVGCSVTGVMFIYFFYKMYFSKLEDESQRTIINNLIVRMLPALLVVAFLIAIYFKS